MSIATPDHRGHRPRRNPVFQLLVDVFTPRTVALTVLDVLAPRVGDPALRAAGGPPVTRPTFVA